MKRITAAWLSLCAAGQVAAADITVSAAASLNNAFREAAAAYEVAHPGHKVLLNFGASDALVAQIAKGAPVDVFASADQEAMDKAQAHVAPGTRRDFASNRLVVAVPAASSLQWRTLADLGQPGVQRLATGNPASVPAGRYARSALEKAGQWQALEPKFVFATNVRQALDYIARGEVEAGLVYQTDVASQAGKVRAVLAVPTATPITYPLAVLKEAPNAAGARGFAEFILSASGQAILARHGFGKQ
ncbi:molybdate ABC transporter substrate-binding protein [Pseudoduganella sp.]|uniref:molybdate ABC transporter substrate-binding protein n=1 Tax=Pseudoduganella sp. TaxID=1880898 RepID=UPI0035AF1D2E